jgi:hypothetical protein
MDIKIFFCAFCDYKTKRKYDLTRHHNAIHIKNALKKTKEENVMLKEENVMLKEENVMLKEENVMLNGENVMLNEENVKQEDILSYNCKKCNKKYKTIKYLINHEKTCNGLNILTCPKCMFTFTSRASKSAHIKKNNCKARSIVYYNTVNNNETIENNKKDNNINCNNNNNNNNTTNNIINNNNTIINNFGSERTDYITLDDIVNIFLKGGDNIIPKYIEYKHFNKDFPENHNIKYEKNKGCSIKNENKWKITDIDYLSNKLLNNNSIELLRYFNNNYIKEKMIKLEIHKFVNSRLNYLDLYIDTKLYNNIKLEIKYIIKSNIKV